LPHLKLLNLLHHLLLGMQLEMLLAKPLGMPLPLLLELLLGMLLAELLGLPFVVPFVELRLLPFDMSLRNMQYKRFVTIFSLHHFELLVV
jgi:hypothetical protein